MTNLNDKRILELKKQIEAKKEKLANTARFTPVTNCSIELDGIRYNINTLIREHLMTLAIKINMYAMSAKELGFPCVLCGFEADSWIGDIKSRIDILSKKDEERQLKAMEEKLSKLLSEEKKVELEIDDIESFLKE